jgi:hypothetical protein
VLNGIPVTVRPAAAAAPAAGEDLESIGAHQ